MSFIERFGLEEQVNTLPDEVVDLSSVSVEPDTNDEPLIENDDDLTMTGQALETMGDLSKIHKVALSSNGFDANAAKLFKLATESMARRLGVSMREEMPAMEHFESIHTSNAATRVSAESVGEFISKIFKAIVDTLKAIWEKLLSFIGGVFSEAENQRVKQYRHVIESEAKRLQGVDKKAKEDKPIYITNLDLIKTFSVSGLGSNDESITRVMENTVQYAEFLAELSKDYGTFLEHVYSMVTEFAEALRSNKLDSVTDIAGSITNYLKTKFNPIFKIMFKNVIKTEEVFDHNKLSQKAYQDDVQATGILGNGTRFAFYFTDDSYYLHCERVEDSYRVTSSHDTLMEVPSIDTVNKCNIQEELISISLKTIQTAFHNTHKKQLSEMFKSLDKAGHEIERTENKLTDVQRVMLRNLMQDTMQNVQRAVTEYQQIYGRGLQAIENTRRAAMLLSKETLTKYQEFAKRSST